MRNGEPADIDHGLAECGLDDTITHADDQEQKERKRVARSVQDGNHDQQDLGPKI